MKGETMAQDWADKIRKLLETANHPNTSPEMAETYRHKAMKLAAQWEIDMLDLTTQPAQKKYEYTITRVNFTGIPKIYWDTAGASMTHIIDALGGMGVAFMRTTGVGIISALDDVDRLTALFHLISTQMNVEFMLWSKNPDTKSKLMGLTAMQKFTVRRSFFTGFSMRVVSRLTETRQECLSQTPGAELVIATKLFGAEQFAEENLKIKCRRAPKISATGYAAGSAAGARADVGAMNIGTNGIENMPAIGN